jgi:hypothetical protein
MGKIASMHAKESLVTVGCAEPALLSPPRPPPPPELAVVLIVLKTVLFGLGECDRGESGSAAAAAVAAGKMASKGILEPYCSISFLHTQNTRHNTMKMNKMKKKKSKRAWIYH